MGVTYLLEHIVYRIRQYLWFLELYHSYVFCGANVEQIHYCVSFLLHRMKTVPNLFLLLKLPPKY